MTAGRIELGKYCVLSIWFGCNNNCSICMLSKVKSNLPAVDFEHYKRTIVDILRDGRFRNLILSGGEITTFQELGAYVSFAKSLDWFSKIQIQTNGRRLSDQRYVEHLIHCGVNEFFVSIHGFDKIHDLLTRISGSFRETLAGLRNLAGTDANVISNTVLTVDNLHQLVNFVDFLCGESIREIHLWNYFPMEERDSRNLIVNLQDLLHVLPELRAIVQAAGKVLVLKSFPLCLSSEAGPPLFFDSIFPVTLLPDLFWKEFQNCGFGKCIYRETGQCEMPECWGLSTAYLGKYGNEKNLLKPLNSTRIRYDGAKKRLQEYVSIEGRPTIMQERR